MVMYLHNRVLESPTFGQNNRWPDCIMYREKGMITMTTVRLSCIAFLFNVLFCTTVRYNTLH
jgi:hypothetical protein